MKFKEYVESINKFLEEHPESGEMKAIYASDDEGNNYDDVWGEPTLMNTNEDDDGWFGGEEEEVEPNAVCIN